MDWILPISVHRGAVLSLLMIFTLGTNACALASGADARGSELIATSGATVTRVRVFLQGGQSNADGRADPTGQPSYPEVDFVYRWENWGGGFLTTLFPGASESRQFGPELAFGAHIADFLACDPGERIAIIKYANGGTSLWDHWAAGGDATTAGDGPEYVKFQDTVVGGLSSLASKHPSAEIVVEAMIWHQGETDAVEYHGYDYYENMVRFADDVRATFGADLPFVIGRLSSDQTHLPASELHLIWDAQTAAADASPYTGLLDTDEMSLKDDHLHYNVDGQLQLGSGFAFETAYLVWMRGQVCEVDILGGGGEPGADADGDGILNVNEFIAGTDLGDASSGLWVTFHADDCGMVEIGFPTCRGRCYGLEACSDLTCGDWTELISVTCTTAGELTYRLAGGAGNAYYRANPDYS